MVLLRWIVGLSLPSLLVGLLLLGLLAREFHRPDLTVRLGAWLLQGNRERQTAGAVWQGILASRRSRDLLERPPDLESLQVASLPKPLLRSRYTLERVSSEFLVIASHERSTPLSTREIPREQMQELATSLQRYQQGSALLAELRLSRASFRTHAFVRAQIALEDGSIFPLLLKELQKANDPQAWTFLEMSPEDEQHWRQALRANFSPDDQGSAPDTTTVLYRASAAVVGSLVDSLYSAEVRRLQRTWRYGGEMQIRLTRSVDSFAGYVVLPNQAPIPVSFPLAAITPIIGAGRQAPRVAP